MATKVFMPKLGLTMKEGTIVHWLVDEGQPVTAGTILFEVENEKAVHEIDAQVSGVLGPHLLKEGETAIIGTVIAYILESGETLADLPQAIESEQAPAQVMRSESTALKAKPEREILASPIAKRLAKEKGIDLSTVQGSGPGGRITEADVLNALKSKAELSSWPQPEGETRGSIPGRAAGDC